ncbi:protein arginine N-methyltransferase 5 [Tremella mesenterica]|uniref:Protein arginine N-methyltransferase n=1 Tax=Tremella mesenterica TaxID=5217 RepID=A0A4Q1BVB1_TREME|nr:protein arginine N-methyltransferase 5 [Tremella mesenterica]
MPRLNIALDLPPPLPSLPNQPHPSPSPLQQLINNTLSSTDYDLCCIPLTNARWQTRWERLCLRLTEDEDLASPEASKHREEVDREADMWRREGGLSREEVNVCRLEETPHLIGLGPEWLDLDSPDEGIRFDSELALRAEMAHAIYVSLPTIIIAGPSIANRHFLPSYARAIAGLLQMNSTTTNTKISIRIPISDPVELISQGPSQPGTNPTQKLPESTSTGSKHKRMSSLSTRPMSIHQSQVNTLQQNQLQQQQQQVPGQGVRTFSGTSAASSTMSARTVVPSAAGDPCTTWEMWDYIRTVCGHDPRLSVTLDLTNPLPPSVGALARWTAEPVSYIWLPAGSFIPNAKGYPVLSKACQAFLRGMAKLSPTYILSGTTMSRHPAGGPTAYLQYLRHITTTPGPGVGMSLANGASAVGDLGAGYSDFLQAPLQPLMDDLGSATYDVFERDPVKYRQYEAAIYLALMDLPQEKTHAIAVAGAGRGPLVACCLSALVRAERKAKIYAVEKNASAFLTLQERKALEWHDAVDIISGDMRKVVLPEQVDLLVSELLGSLGDNELSPECLDGAARFLKPDGFSIPMSYTAHIAPVSSSKLHYEVSLPTRPAGAAETPYVVMMSAVNALSGEGPGPSGRCGERIQQCWQFEHPRKDLILGDDGLPLNNTHNTRSAHMSFHIPHAGPLHGLAGYFEAHLYGNIGLSIHPENMSLVSPDMFSWFPLFFPFIEPLHLPSNCELVVSLWRLTDRVKVWYEWCAEAFLPLEEIRSERRVSAQQIIGISSMGLGGGAPSPYMDAPTSPIYPTHGNYLAGGGRVKIGQTRLHNVGGKCSSIGL